MNKTDRLLSLDALRGFDMMFIMGVASLIVAVCNLLPGDVSQAISDSMHHVEWNGLRHHDTIFPLFLFLAGVSFPFSLAKQRAYKMSSRHIYLKIIKRAVILILLGMIYNGLFALDFEHLRCASVLGRIGIAWMFAAIFFLNFSVYSRIFIAVFILLGYGLLSMFISAPDVPNGDPLSREGCLVGFIDRCFLPGRLIYDEGRFDPEGLLSAVPAIVTAMLGMFTGEFIKETKSQLSGGRKTLYMLLAAAVLAIIAFFWGKVLPINKMLWSSTFVCAVGAYSLALMAIFYYIIDVRKKQSWTLFFRVIGMNSITIYMAQRIIGFSDISDFFFHGFAGLFSENIATLINAIGYVVICWLFLYFLYRKNTFLKV